MGDEMRDFDYDDELVITGVGVISVWQGGSDYAHVQGFSPPKGTG